MSRKVRTVAAAAAIALVPALPVGPATAAAAAGTVYGRPTPGAPTTDTATLQHARRVAPLNALADALDEQGRADHADAYGNLSVDEDGGTVTLYAVSEEQGRRLVDAAKAAHPDIDAGLVRFAHADYSKRDLAAQVDRILQATAVERADDLEVYTVAVNPDASGITVTGRADRLDSVRNSIRTGAASTDTAASAASTPPVEVVAGDPARPATWRWDEDRPQMGGDVLLGPAREAGYVARCTSGLATEDAAGRDYLLTAAHCYPNGAEVHGEGDPVGQFGTRPGGRIGRVVKVLDRYVDAEVIDTGGSNGSASKAREADTPAGRWYRVTTVGRSHNGQSVCQDGARSYYTGHGVPCGIKVQNDSIAYTLAWDDGSVHAVFGVVGYNENWACTQGDSGGLVFTVSNNTDREGRGLVSANSAGKDGPRVMYWAQAPDILNIIGQRLNPHH